MKIQAKSRFTTPIAQQKAVSGHRLLYALDLDQKQSRFVADFYVIEVELTDAFTVEVNFVFRAALYPAFAAVNGCQV